VSESRVDERTVGNGEGQLLDTLEQAPSTATTDCLSYNAGDRIITLIRQVRANDLIKGQAGNDRMNRGLGTDRRVGGPGRDTARGCEKGRA
jgi:hypothetical protein